jgi:hypothetical protein
VLEIYKTIADYGISGGIIVALLWYILRLDRRLVESQARLQQECDLRVKDAKAYTDLALELDGRVIKALNHLGDLFGQDLNGAATFHEE